MKLRLSRPLAALGFAAIWAMSSQPVAAEGAGDMSQTQRESMRTEFRAYLLEHPEVIMEAIQVLELRRKEAEATSEAGMVSSISEDLRNDGYSFVAGNPDGDVTVVEFTDYNCGYCKRAHEDVKALIRMDPNVRLVIKEFPILGPSSRIAAEAAMAAIAQQGGDAYLEFNDLMMKNRGALDEATVYQLAERAGLDVGLLRSDARDPKIAKNLARTSALAQKLRIEGTPTFVIGDQIVRGFVPLKDLQAAVAEQRANKG
ncbi:MAG: protein-disulfide isomerase [Paracoccaceae bacterium]|jgi:protein-disulfide isomerase